MKISLFNKPYITKAYSFFIIFSLVAGTPLMASASFFSNIATAWRGESAQAEETTAVSGEIVRNSQTLAFLESSIDPDVKNSITSDEDEIIVQDDSFIYSNGLFGTDDLGVEKSPLSDKMYVYTVKKGDTLSEIAESFDISMNTIRWENNISGGAISIGQKLNILPVTGVKHIVKSGDTISKIAVKYEAETEDILIFNDIAKGDVLKKGDIIFVPNGIIKTVAVAKTTSSGSSQTTVSSNTKVTSGYYLRPVSGIVTSPYGSRKGGFHYGIDIGNKRGTPVVASASGTVVKVVSSCKEGAKSCGGRYGNYIVIQHSNGTSTFYAHLSKHRAFNWPPSSFRNRKRKRFQDETCILE